MCKLIIISGLCAVTAALAQTPSNKTIDEASQPMGISVVMSGPPATIPGAPYSAKAVTQQIQILLDGNRITKTTSDTVARDSQGRFYRQISMPGFNFRTGESSRSVIIEDPVAAVNYTLDPSSKIAMKSPGPDQKTIDEQIFSASHPFARLNGVRLDSSNATTTDLGTQTMEGVQVKGTRVVYTLPAGSVGNDAPLVITTETWFSPELKVLVMSKSSDPRIGETTYRLTNLVRAEPDSSLFRIPLDYTVKVVPTKTFTFKNTDK